MGGQLVTGTLGGSTPHVTSGQFGELNIGIFGRDSYVLDVGTKLEATVVSNNEVHIGSGDLVIQGRQVTVDEAGVTFTLTSGTQGMKRNDLICATYHKDPTTGVESVTGDVITGIPDQTSPVDPPHTEGDIYAGDIIAQVPVYRITFDGVNIGEPELILKTLLSADEITDASEIVLGSPRIYINSEVFYIGSVASKWITMFTPTQLREKYPGITSSKPIVYVYNGSYQAVAGVVRGIVFSNGLYLAEWSENLPAGTGIRLDYAAIG